MEKGARSLPERHLVLVVPEQAEKLNFQADFHVDDEVLATVFSDWLPKNSRSVNKQGKLAGKKIAIAKDAACCFIYPANIDWLKEQGVEVVYFSILKGEPLPNNTDAVWLPGGYPELYGQQLSDSTSWESLNQFIKNGKPVLAECGGSMLLGEQLIDLDGRAWSMSGLLSFSSTMQKKLASLGYREDVSGIKGHEFHYSTRQGAEEMPPCFECARGDKGIRYKNLRLSYIHWYFSSAPEVIEKWLGS
jgi:cobyrinic acid a,c-diamide synthase